MGLLRSRSQMGGPPKTGDSILRQDSAMAERSMTSTTTVDTQRNKSVSSQERPKTAHSQPERPKTADRHVPDRPKTADRQQAVNRRSFSRPRTATSAHSAGRVKDKEQDTQHNRMALPTQTIEYKTGVDTYRFPTPSPRLPPQRSATTHVPSPARSPLPGATVDDSPRIGVAIGSPSEPAPHWGRTHTVDQVATQASTRPAPARAKTEMAQVPVEKNVEQLPKKKGSWKSFGGIFGRKPSTKAPPAEPFYQLRPPQEREEQPAAPTRTLHSAARHQPQPAPGFSGASDSVPVTPSTRARAMTRGMARMEARKEADRATFEDKENHHQSSRQKRAVRTPSIIQKESASPAFGSPVAPRTSEDIFKAADSAAKRNDSPLSNVDGSGLLRLDLDIPDHHMERYSIMFENFLSNSAERRPSIIERRQSKLQKKRSLKRLDETKKKDKIEMPRVPQRSATSPHLSHMPGSLSIKTGKKVRSPKGSPLASPTAEAHVTAVHHPRPVRRSNTAPIKTAECAVRQNFSKPRMVMVTEPTATDSAPQLPHLSMYSENSLPPTPTSGDESGEESPFQPPPLPVAPPKPHHRAADDSGTWDMLTANPNTNAIPKRKGSLARQEPNNTGGNPYRRVKSPEDLESRVVQVSVARQVSVSKARKQVRQAVDAKQPLRPRVVELGKNRKSTMVLIEGAEE